SHRSTPLYQRWQIVADPRRRPLKNYKTLGDLKDRIGMDKEMKCTSSVSTIIPSAATNIKACINILLYSVAFLITLNPFIIYIVHDKGVSLFLWITQHQKQTLSTALTNYPYQDSLNQKRCRHRQFL